MLLQTIISLTVVVTLTVVMSFLLARVVKQINKQSKDYFEKKIVVYDELIDEKEKLLDEVETKIQSLEEENIDQPTVKNSEKKSNNLIVVNEKLPEYKIDDFFEQAKKIDESFKIDKTEMVKKFVSSKVNGADNDNTLTSLNSLYDKLNNENSFDNIASSTDDGWGYVKELMDAKARNVMEQYMVGSPKADINEIMGYVKLEIDKLSPEIVVETGDKGDSFDAINKRIKTIYNPDIYMGLRIIYQDRMYDYSLRGL